MVTLRLLCTTDKDSFISLMNEYTKEYIEIENVYPVEFHPELGQSYWEYLQNASETFITVIAEEQSVLVGFYIGYVHEYNKVEALYYQGEKRGEGLELYVNPAYRNKHIGEQLMTYLEQEFIKEGCQHIVLNNVHITNTGPQKLYQRLGYIPWTMNFYKKVEK